MRHTSYNSVYPARLNAPLRSATSRKFASFIGML